jgi:hypothetical protein
LFQGRERLGTDARPIVAGKVPRPFLPAHAHSMPSNRVRSPNF